jgi:hypothetical protein
MLHRNLNCLKSNAVANLRKLFPPYGRLLEKSAAAIANPIFKKRLCCRSFGTPSTNIFQFTEIARLWHTVATSSTIAR